MQIGFIGLGAMGAAMARNLLESGHAVCVFNRSPARVEPLRDAGATVASSPAQAVQSADVVFTMAKLARWRARRVSTRCTWSSC